jgi:hypothetical protein
MAARRPDRTTSFTGRALEIGRQHHGVASEEGRIYNAAMTGMRTAPPGFTGTLDIERLHSTLTHAPIRWVHHRDDVPLRDSRH